MYSNYKCAVLVGKEAGLLSFVINNPNNVLSAYII